ncbi:hypothetical protein Poli38472_004825 [Pythium oligandrum]|uniref:Uncharacterized protein n=1 Tax=Pythium oligandrum TaxID=41045 RepID=A0A8K1CB73_PYTOL|nr:hypothetical protein Poli38472_004825 [Pythium oligandrum]|eukprot:TMW59756.1 hypothetical protein Poli38472_004825 [Pythium oligandrum]
MVKLFATVALASLATASATPNWVGPKVGRPVDSACYRKTLRVKTCPPGYNSDKAGGCWAQCPIEYPVECGMECLPQSKDCASGALTKVNAVATAAFKTATGGIAPKLVGFDQVQAGVKCGLGLYHAVEEVSVVTQELRAQNPSMTTPQLVVELLKTEEVLSGLTSQVVSCTGLPSAVNDVARSAVKRLVEAIASKGAAVLAPDVFLALANEVGITKISEADVSKLKTLFVDGKCGYNLQSILRHVIDAVIQIKKKTPDVAQDELRAQLEQTDLFKKDIPKLTNDCASGADAGAFEKRDSIRKMLQSLIDKVIDGAYQNGNPVPVETYIVVVANLGLDALSSIDPTGLANLAKEFVQPICGPTSMVGEIDNGSADVALGLHAEGKALSNSNGTWTLAGDGQVKIFFESTDSKDVTVNVLSGGQKIGSVEVKKGGNAEWSKPLSVLQDKTLYLDRWRRGLVGIPGTGGGSLVTWIPHSSEGGHLELHAKLNIS